MSTKGSLKDPPEDGMKHDVNDRHRQSEAGKIGPVLLNAGEAVIERHAHEVPAEVEGVEGPVGRGQEHGDQVTHKPQPGQARPQHAQLAESKEG